MQLRIDAETSLGIWPAHVVQFGPVIDRLPVMVYFIDSEFRLQGFGGGALRALRREELEAGLGTDLRELAEGREDGGLPSIPIVRRALGGETGNCITRWDGRDYQTSLTPAYDLDGTIIGCVGLSIDVTDHTKALLELDIYRERYRCYYDSPLLGLSIVADNTRWLDANERFCAMLGYTREELHGKSWLELTHPEDRERFLAMLGQAREGKIDTLTSTKRYVTKDGSICYTKTHSRCVRRADGSIRFIASLVQDLTECQASTEHRLRAEQELAHLDRLRSVSELAAMLTHELAHPLTTISLHADSALANLEGCGEAGASAARTQAAQRAVERIRGQAERARDIVEKLRALARRSPSTDLGEDVLERRPQRLDELVREVVDLVTPEFRQAECGLDVELPECGPIVAVDRAAIQQLLLNLLRNSRDASLDTRARSRKVFVRVRRAPEGVFLQVADEGCGIPPCDHQLVFEPFHTTKPEGMGMGLTICRRIAQAHGGTLEVEENEAVESGGTIATLYLPATEKAGSDGPPTLACPTEALSR